ncbi:MAG TPA: protein translocase subunit SecF [Gemmatimonadaceae bacterium]|nr:protein translocase subunit SecF [Gemmatimonadaceae bacterium]
MFRILHDTKIDFIRYWRIAVGLTVAFVLAGMVPLVLKGINYSIEFTGGTVVQVKFAEPPGSVKLHEALRQGGLPDAEAVQFGGESEYVIKAREAETTQSGGAEGVAAKIQAALTAAFGDKFHVEQTDAIGGRVGSELARGALIAILVSFGITLAYLAWRFEWRFGVAAVAATAHDIFATLAFIKLLNLEVSLTVIAGILTVIGYSLNDTIIIFDRVRENLHKTRRESLYDLLNRSVNETLPRSVLTHTTALAATLTLLIWGGETIRPFAWVMSFGIFTGTFSSVYIASPVLLWIEHKFPRAEGAARVRAASAPAAAGSPAKPAPRGRQQKSPAN